MHLCQDARILNVTETNIVGCQCQPGTIRLGDAVRHFVFDAPVIARTPMNTLFRVNAIVYSHVPGGRLRQHHQTPHACR